MKRIMQLAAIAAALTFAASGAALAQEKVRLTGSGASFPARLRVAVFFAGALRFLAVPMGLP